ncbi:MAG: PilZ domain-containing protein [Candidatus Omnitrophica bacterium]|nr:PilZ domain-containing protein [Candidatus Omnitrophota bacterium]
MFTDRRAYPRANLDYGVDVCFDLRIFSVYSEIINISAGGVRVLIEEKVDVNTPVDIKLSPRGAEPIRCKGEVVWLNERPLGGLKRTVFDTGIRFTEIKTIDKERIRNAVDAAIRTPKIS